MTMNRLLPLLSLSLMTCGAALTAAPDRTGAEASAGASSTAPQNQTDLGVYPVPQKVKKGQGTLEVNAFDIKGANVDSDSVAALKGYFRTAPQGTPLLMGIRTDAALKEFAADIPDVVGAYRLLVEPDRVIVVGHDDAGLFYGIQTLSQLAKKEGKGWTLSQVDILDWPDVPFRGTVEGFYGKPWGYEDRISQLKFYGKYKLNTYLYGPKDDPFHGFSTRWREPYPKAEAEHMKELVKEAKRNKVNFVWAVHPGRDIKWGEADNRAALKKYEMMYDLGVRSFGVFFDDIGGEGAKAEGQVEFLNFLNREFIHKKPDVTPLVMCPTQYNRSWSGGDYLDILGDKLDKDINVMWTGNSVVCDIDKKGLEWINGRIRRPAYIWWNFPVSDYVRHAVLLGRIYGLEKGTQKDMSAFVSNPMDKPEASKVTLFGVADFTWNQNGFDSEKSWKAGIRKLFPACADAMQTMANHNSDPGPSGHGYRKEESVEIAPVVSSLLEGMREGRPMARTPQAAKLRNEFKAIAEAPAVIRAKADNPAFINEVTPWLVSFEQLGRAGTGAMQMNEALEANDMKKALSGALEAIGGLSKMDEASEHYTQVINDITKDGWQKSIKTGTLVMRPAVEEMLDLGGSKLYSKLSGRPANVRRPYLSSKLIDGVEKMFDDDPESFYYCREIQKKGDYYGVDLGEPQEIKTVHIVMGRNDGDHDAVNKGQLEISMDGKQWQPLMEETTGNRVSYEGSGKKARFVRYRSTHAGVPGGKSDVWTAFRDFKVNAPAGSAAFSNVPALKNLQLSRDAKSLSITPLLEVVVLGKGDQFGITLPSAPFIARAEFDFKTGDMDWAVMEITKDGRNWTPVSLEKSGDKFRANISAPLKGIRLTNKTGAKQEMNLAEFRLNYPEGGAANTAAATDGKLTTKFDAVLGDTPVSIPNAIPQAGTVFIFSDGSPADISAQDSKGKWEKIGQLGKTGNFTQLKIKKGTQALGLTGKKGQKTAIYEVIWR